MPTYAFGLQYNGTAYHGWQCQRQVPSLQAAVESAVSQLANKRVSVICAGRTDAGVHAMNQVINFQTDVSRPDIAWLRGTNAYLPTDICVRWVKEVPAEFHARFSATSRRYQYVIFNNPLRSSVLYNGATWWYKPLNTELMQLAGQYLMGEHDFTSFRGPHCQARTPIRTLLSLDVRRYQDWVIVDISANAFLQHMVRNIVGVLLKIGAGECSPLWASEVLAAKDRQQAALTAPAKGLYFMDVGYPEIFGLPKLAVDDAMLPFLAL